MDDYHRLIDTNTAGPRYDVTPLFSDYKAFADLVEDLARPFTDAACDCVAGIDALGFILGAAVALEAAPTPVTIFCPINFSSVCLPIAVGNITMGIMSRLRLNRCWPKNSRPRTGSSGMRFFPQV